MNNNQDSSNGRVATDGVHRRFRQKKNNESKSASPKETPKDDHFYCKQCNVNINASNGKGKLQYHFETVQHAVHNRCVYCSKPVYEYVFNRKLEIYHQCVLMRGKVSLC